MIANLKKFLLIEQNISNKTKFNEDKTSGFYDISKSLNSNYLADLEEQKIYEHVKNKINIQNVTTFHQLSQIFNLPTLRKVASNFTECYFTMVAETDNFLQLDYTYVAKILRSSHLHITSELEVLNAADDWVKYNIKERSKFANRLLQNVRLPLLSETALEYLLNESSSFNQIDECVTTLKEVIQSKNELFNDKLSINWKHRYCDKQKFKILLCGGVGNVVVRNVKEIDGSNFKNVEDLAPMIESRDCAKTVCLKGEVYVFGGNDDNLNWKLSVEKYTPSANTWKEVTDLKDERYSFCVSAFMDKIVVIGGYYEGSGERTKSCLQFDTKGYKWTEIASMNEARSDAACVVFEGKVVVSGGFNTNNVESNTVESYDVLPNKWSSMPNMINVISDHSLVVVRSKLFVITYATDVWEVFDNIYNKFVAFKLPHVQGFNFNESVSIGSKIVLFQNDRTSLYSYNVDNGEWSEDFLEITEEFWNYSCVTVPFY